MGQHTHSVDEYTAANQYTKTQTPGYHRSGPPNVDFHEKLPVRVSTELDGSDGLTEHLGNLGLHMTLHAIHQNVLYPDLHSPRCPFDDWNKPKVTQ